MKVLMNMVYGTDVVVFGTPVYSYTVSTCLKRFLDMLPCSYYWKADELGGVHKLYGNLGSDPTVPEWKAIPPRRRPRRGVSSPRKNCAISWPSAVTSAA